MNIERSKKPVVKATVLFAYPSHEVNQDWVTLHRRELACV